nr:FAD-dependent oxidoreductase [Angustibacter aerolatus]
MSATTPVQSPATRPSPVRDKGDRPRVVVVGGGFAGLWAVREPSVADVDVLLVDRNAYNTFQPLLYQVATAGLNPGDVTYALRAFTSRFRNADFLRAEVTSVDPDGKEIVTHSGDRIPFDFLVVACGVGANFFGIPGAQEHAQTMYTRTGALAVRDRVLTAIEDAAQGKPGAIDPTVVVVGGGATGVEMAGALAEPAQRGRADRLPRGSTPSGCRSCWSRWPTGCCCRSRRSLQEYTLKEPAQARCQRAAADDGRGGPRGRRRREAAGRRARDHPVRLGDLGQRRLGEHPHRRLGAAQGQGRPRRDEPRPVGRRLPVHLRRGRRRHRPRRPAAAPGPAGHPGRQARRRPDPADARRVAHAEVHVPRQGHHGDDRSQRRRRAVPVRRHAEGSAGLAVVARAAHRLPDRQPQPLLDADQPGRPLPRRPRSSLNIVVGDSTD